MAAIWTLIGLLGASLGVLTGAMYNAMSSVLVRIDALGTELRGEIGSLRTEVRGEIVELRADMNSRFEVVHADIRELRTALRAS
jgi:hypothetical protein